MTTEKKARMKVTSSSMCLFCRKSPTWLESAQFVVIIRPVVISNNISQKKGFANLLKVKCSNRSKRNVRRKSFRNSSEKIKRRKRSFAQLKTL